MPVTNVEKKKAVGGQSVDFYPGSHRYKVNNEWTPGVSTILSQKSKGWLTDYCLKKAIGYTMTHGFATIKKEYLETTTALDFTIKVLGTDKESKKNIEKVIDNYTTNGDIEDEKIVDTYQEYVDGTPNAELLKLAVTAHIIKTYDDKKEAKIGTNVHAMVEADQNSWVIPQAESVEANECYKKYLKFKSENIHTPILQEQSVVISTPYGDTIGTFDDYCILNNTKTLLDIKTSKDIFEDYTWQCDAYAEGLKQAGKEVEQIAVLLLPKPIIIDGVIIENKDYELKVFPVGTGYPVFLALVNLYFLTHKKDD